MQKTRFVLLYLVFSVKRSLNKGLIFAKQKNFSKKLYFC